jgi:hypothetical protein
MAEEALGCLGCKVCTRNNNLIEMDGNVPRINYDKYDPQVNFEPIIEKWPRESLVFVGDPGKRQLTTVPGEGLTECVTAENGTRSRGSFQSHSATTRPPLVSQYAIPRLCCLPILIDVTAWREAGFAVRWLFIPIRHGSCGVLLVMRVAIPFFGGRISPVFDTARRLLLVDIEDGREVWRTEQIVEEPELGPRARRVAELGADVLICGAISWPLEVMLLSARVEVIPQTIPVPRLVRYAAPAGFQ